MNIVDNYKLLTCILKDNQNKRRSIFPPTYILPHSEWPTDLNAPELKELPIINIAKTPNDIYDRTRAVEEVMYACEHFGMFQVIVNQEHDMVLKNAMRSATNFFDLPSLKLYEFSEPLPSKRLLYSSTFSNFSKRELHHHYWRDVLTLGLESVVPTDGWPTKPTNFKTDIWQFAKLAKSIEARLLNLISQGLGLRLGEKHFTSTGLTGSSFINVTRFPPCPDPSRALGLPKHGDPNLITISFQGDVPGLHLLHNDQWRLVAPRKDALVVKVGHQLAVVSNDRLKAARQRTVVNRERARTSICYHSAPANDCVVGPAPELTQYTPPVYKNFEYTGFLSKYLENERNVDSVLPSFMRLNNN